eukprot:s1333_g4.t1
MDDDDEYPRRLPGSPCCDALTPYEEDEPEGLANDAEVEEFAEFANREALRSTCVVVTLLSWSQSKVPSGILTPEGSESAPPLDSPASKTKGENVAEVEASARPTDREKETERRATSSSGYKASQSVGAPTCDLQLSLPKLNSRLLQTSPAAMAVWFPRSGRSLLFQMIFLCLQEALSANVPTGSAAEARLLHGLLDISERA